MSVVITSVARKGNVRGRYARESVEEARAFVEQLHGALEWHEVQPGLWCAEVPVFGSFTIKVLS